MKFYRLCLVIILLILGSGCLETSKESINTTLKDFEDNIIAEVNFLFFFDDENQNTYKIPLPYQKQPY